VDKESKYVLNITEGPLTYRYQFQEFYIHFGTDNNLGSEHKIQGYSFPAEVSIYITIFSSNKPWLNNNVHHKQNEVDLSFAMICALVFCGGKSSLKDINV